MTERDAFSSCNPQVLVDGSMRWRATAAAALLIASGCGTRPQGPNQSRGSETSSGSTTGDAQSDVVSAERYLSDLEFIAKPRVPGSAHWQAVQDRCAEVLSDAGYAVTRQDYGTGVNVIGIKRGTTLPKEVVIVGGHYDSVGGCAGADDNATGVAGALEAARVLASGSYARTLVVACWDEEERGLIGSTHHASTLAAEGETGVVAYSLEMLGYASSEPNSQRVPDGFELLFPEQVQQIIDNEKRGDFITVVYNESARPSAESIAEHAESIELPTISLELDDGATSSLLLSNLRRSDHASYWDVGVPALMITDTANFRNDHYHCTTGPDEVSDLDHEFATKVIAAVAESARTQLQAP